MRWVYSWLVYGMANQALTAYLVAGEASGDFLGAQLMQALKTQKPDIVFHGVGGPRMNAQGIASLFPYHELSLMGVVEILPYVLKIAGRINLTVEDILAKQPDVVITIDSPGFNFRVVKKLRAAGCTAKFVHYVAPTVWMYKPERAAACAQLFDHMLLLLPFEPPYFEKEGLACTFIGHPVIAETSPGDGAAFRKKYEIAETTTLFSLFPGSRKSEIKRHMPIFARAITALAPYHRDMAIAVPVPGYALPYVAPYFQNCPFRAVVTSNEEDKKNAVAASALAVSKSGTVTLEIAHAGTPMIVAHRVHPITARILKRQALLPYVTLINILLNKEIIPELLQDACTPSLIASAVSELISSTSRQSTQKISMHEALAMLRPPKETTASAHGAKVILQLL
jgi:lipid-A-disaccharide synthase